MRDNFIKRAHHQRTGYWKPDGEGMEVLATSESAAALKSLAGRRVSVFVASAKTLLGQWDHALGLKLTDTGLVSYPKSEALGSLRRQALEGLRAKEPAAQSVQVHHLLRM